mgnify:CR=1 FL=1
MTEIKMTTAKIKDPFKITRQEVENYIKMKYYTELTLVREKLALFEKKYQCNFSQFEKSIKKSAEEDFEGWDDYIEWKAFYHKYSCLKKKVIEI